MIQIGQVRVGAGCKPFIIAEMSGNHQQSLTQALALVEAAAKSGAHALKLQTYTADTMTIDCDQPAFRIEDPQSLWAGRTLYDLYQEAHTPWAWHPVIFERARALGMLAFSTPFDETAVDFLESLAVPCYKIASFENTDLPLIRKVAATGKPLIISTGMATESEIAESVQAAREAGCKDLILLKCTSAYPASPHHSHLATLPHLRTLFQCEVGLSDHTLGIGVALASVALGASVIEKHITLSRAQGGVDSAFSLEPAELQQLVQESQRAFESLGQIHYGPTPAEQKSLQFRRSLYIVKDMQPGDRLTPSHLRAIRPGFGLPPKYFAALLNRSVNQPVLRGTPAAFSLLEEEKK